MMRRKYKTTQVCITCGAEIETENANFCLHCGGKLGHDVPVKVKKSDSNYWIEYSKTGLQYYFNVKTFAEVKEVLRENQFIDAPNEYSGKNCGNCKHWGRGIPESRWKEKECIGAVRMGTRFCDEHKRGETIKTMITHCDDICSNHSEVGNDK